MDPLQPRHYYTIMLLIRDYESGMFDNSTFQAASRRGWRWQLVAEDPHDTVTERGEGNDFLKEIAVPAAALPRALLLLHRHASRSCPSEHVGKTHN